jgi:hypothetical protein
MANAVLILKNVINISVLYSSSEYPFEIKMKNETYVKCRKVNFLNR